MSKLALITGATSGIGKATAEAFADLGINLILCGRRMERLYEIQEIQKIHYQRLLKNTIFLQIQFFTIQMLSGRLMEDGLLKNMIKFLE